ncbi:hypothetical protein [Nonomuraea pusilla]|uniref:Uncharacterized protein n=1 Tax=Nonomuraea pusilla TaxID=46177 RepID=A0A1H8HW67_9ACTN|nr:hypothetical protein [Nonomuraea pusilla]SEN60372.1 hypothetical protein SAMN05660976_07914 [Nonomuraea pusilla]
MSKEQPIRTGRRDARPDTPSHVKGVKEGNSTGNYDKQEGHLPDGRSTAARSTGIQAGSRDPIDPDSPSLSPA